MLSLVDCYFGICCLIVGLYDFAGVCFFVCLIIVELYVIALLGYAVMLSCVAVYIGFWILIVYYLLFSIEL